MKIQKINLGKVGITVEYDYWDYNKSYDKLTVVQDHNHNTFLSRKPVPKENDLNNRTYWIPVIQNVSLSELYDDLDIIRQSLTDFKNEHQADINQIISTLISHGNSIEGIIQAITEIQTVLTEYATISYVDNTIINNVNSLKQFISENYIDNVELQSSINSINQNIQNVENRLQQNIDYKINETNDALNKEIKAIKGDEYNTLLKLPTLSNLAIDLQNNQLENNNKFNILDNTILNINKNVTTINNELIVTKNTINSLETEINKSVINVTRGYNNGTILVKTRDKEEEIQIPGLNKFAFAESITAEEVGADIKGSANNALLEAKQHSYELTTKEVADRNTAISEHNLSTTSHPDIRGLIQNLNDKVTAVLNSTDEDLDTFKELVDYIKDNRDLLAGKVNITDIVNNLTTNVANKPLSAAQGVILKNYINDLESLIDTKASNDDLVKHINDNIKHITSNERSKWNEAYDKIWNPSNKTTLENTTASYTIDEKNKLMTVEAGAEINQKAYSSVLVESPNQSSEIISAINKTDQLILSGSVNTSLKIEDGKIVIESKDTIYGVATDSLGGLMSAADKIALDVLNNSNVSSINSTAKWGDSLTVNIKGVEKTLTIPNKPTLADLTNNLTSLGTVNAGSVNQPVYFKNGVPTAGNKLEKPIYYNNNITPWNYVSDGILLHRHNSTSNVPNYDISNGFSPNLSFIVGSNKVGLAISSSKDIPSVSFYGGSAFDTTPSWYFKLKGTDTATYTLPTKTSTLASIDDIPTKLSQFTDDVVKDNYLSLTGGTISGSLNIGNSTNTSYLPIIFNRNNIQWLLAHNGNNFSIDNGDKSLIIGESIGLKYNANLVFDSNNYTTYINTTNFPGLFNTGTLNSIQIGSNIYSGTNGIVTLPQSLPMPESNYDTTDTTNVLKHDGSWGIPALAEDLGGREETHHEEFFFQPTAGNDLSIKDGYAKIKSLKGNTIVWNQLVNEVRYYTSQTQNSTDFNIYDLTSIIEASYHGIVISNKLAILNHKYYIKIEILENEYTFIRINSNREQYNTDSLKIDNGAVGIFSSIITKTKINFSTTNWEIQFDKLTIGKKIKFKRPIIIDLTQMFGEGNEPTIEEFEAMYPDDYYEYNEGELRNFNGSSIKSVGFNQISGLRQGHIISSEIGTDINYITLGSGNVLSYPIKVFPNTFYYLFIKNTSWYVIEYDCDKKLCYTHYVIGTSGLYKTKENTHYILLQRNVTTIQEEINKINFNLSHTNYRNGQYEPYKESRLQLPIKTIKDNNGDLLFPDGLRSAGTAYDEIVYDEGLGKYKAIKRIGSLDMGSLDYTYIYGNSSEYDYIESSTSPTNIKKENTNVKSVLYNGGGIGITSGTDLTIYATEHGPIRLRNLKYTDVDSFKQSLQGQILYYELETPIEVILDNIDLSYEAWDFGTEELLSDVATTPIITETQYNFNAVDMIRNNYFAIKALKEADPLNDLADVAFSGDYNDLENKPESIKNPNALIITKGSTTTNYDGNEAKTVSIPTKTSELTKDDVYSKTEVYTQKQVNDLINNIEGVVGGIVNTWRPITIQNNSGTNILSLGEGATSGGLTLKAGNNITFSNNNGVVTIGSTYSYTLPAASTTLGGIKTGGDLTLSNGIATVNGLSTISNNASKGLEAYNWGNHAGKYPTYDGTGATGTWNIDINGSADKLNNLDSSDFVRKYGIVGANYTNDSWIGYTYNTEAHGGATAGGLISAGVGNSYFQLNGSAQYYKLFYRYANDGNVSNWKQLAFTDDIPTKLSDLTDDVVEGNYLPLTGGTLSSHLQISSGNDSKLIFNNTDTEKYYQFILFCQDGTQYGYLGTIGSTNLVWSGATVLHANNYTSYINETNFPGINKTGTYNKPTAGIPKSDLDLSVQTSLGKADTALQSYTEQYRGTVTGIQMNGGTFAPTDGIVNLGTVITAHQSLAAYAKLASPTFTGTPKAPTATAGTNNTQIATTAFVKTAIDNKTSIAYATEAGKVTKALKFGTKTYNGSSEQTITAADLGLEAALKYCGITTTQLYDGSTANPIIIDNKNHTAVAGCTVFYNSKEFVFNGSKWEEIGDESSFKVKQTAVSSPTASGSATAFIDTISQDTNGNITVTKKNVSFPAIPTSFNIGVNLTDDNIVNLTGNGGANNVTIAATHAEKGPSAGYTSGNTTTSVSGYGDSKTIKIPQITVDKYGHVTAAVDESVTITMPSAQTIPSLSGGVVAGINKVLSGITVSGHTITPTQKTLKGTGKVSINDDGSTITINGSGDTYTGTVKSITAGTGLLGGTITESGTISLATVGTIAGNFGLSANTTPGYAGTFKVPYITVDNYGRVTAISEKTVTMPSAQTIPSYSAGAGLTLNANNVFKTNVPRKSTTSKAIPGLNTFVVEEYTSNSPNLPTAHYYHIYTAEGSDSKYATQLALGLTTNAAYYRIYNNESWGNWNSLINTDTHYITGINVGASSAITNSMQTNPYVTIKDNNTNRGQFRLIGSGATTITSDSNGNITIKSTDTNTNTTYSAGTGLTLNNTIFNLKLNSNTSLGTIGSTSKLYPIGIDSNGQLAVKVPWSDTNTDTTYNIATSTIPGLVKPINVITKPIINSATTNIGRYYPIEMSSDGNMFVNIPWANTTYTSLKNPYALSLQINGTTKTTYDGSITKTFNITAADLGLSNVMKFIGTTTTQISDGSTTSSIKINDTTVTVKNGDVVIYETKEFIWDGNTWEEFGNEGNYKVIQTAVNSPTASGSTYQFIDSISQNTQGVITATKKSVREASTSQSGLMTSSMVTKLNNISESADAVSFTRLLSNGTKIGTININGTNTDLYCEKNTDTHHVTRLYVGESGTTSNTDTRDPYLKVTDDNTYRNQIQIKGTGNTSVVSSPNGVITINSSDTYTGTVTSVKVGSTSYSPSSGIVSLPAYPTTLPASDVYSWAKGSSKPTYTTDEVSEGSTNKYYTDARAKAAMTGAISTAVSSNLTANRVAIINSNGKLAASSNITTTELDYINGVTSNIQTQLNNKQATINNLSTIIINAANGATAYNWGNHADVGYLTNSDVYDWAKASTKPSYSWNEITNKPTIPIVGNASITIKQNGTTIGAFNANQLDDITITLPNTATYGVGTPGSPGLAEPAGATSDTGFILNNHAECYHAVQINGDGKLVVNIPNKYFVATEKLTAIEIGSSQKIVYECYESESTIDLYAKEYNTSTHLYFVNGTTDKATLLLKNVDYGAHYFIINTELSIDLYVTETGTIVAEPIKVE